MGITAEWERLVIEHLSAFALSEAEILKSSNLGRRAVEPISW